MKGIDGLFLVIGFGILFLVAICCCDSHPRYIAIPQVEVKRDTVYVVKPDTIFIPKPCPRHH